jgi:hypothetical protein
MYSSLPLMIIAILIAILTGCATTEPAAAPEQEEPPEWVVGELPTEPEYEYFRGIASDSAGDRAAAEEQARNNVISEIVQYLGVEVNTKTTAEARASLDDFQASVRQTVTQEAGAQLAGLRLQDEFVDKRDDRVTVYVLFRYEKQALSAERERIQAAFREREEAISGPEAEGMAFESDGDYYQAARRYIAAAAAAIDSEVENAAIKFERNINNAKNVIQKLELVKGEDNLSTLVNQPFEQPFEVTVTAPNGTGVAGVQILVSHKILRSNGRMGIRQDSGVTDETGTFGFTHPAPEFVGEDTVTMALDLSAELQTLSDVDRSQRTIVSSLEDVVLRKRVTFQYSVFSRAKDTPTGIVFLDTDIAGNPITPSDATASGLLQELSEAGFQVKTLAYDPTLLLDHSDAEIIQMLSANFEDDVERVIYGVASIESFDESDGFLVKVSGSVRALDLRTGEVLYASSTFRNSRGSTSAGAIASAFRNLGARFGEEMARSLP